MSLVLLFHYLLLNVFRILVHPSSGVCDLLWIYFMCCIALVRSLLVLRCGSAGVVWYPSAGWSRALLLFTAQHVSNVSTSIFRSLQLIVDLFHVLYCSGSMCVGVTVWFGWGGVVSLCRLKHCFNVFRILVHPSSGACDLLWIYFTCYIVLVRCVLVLRCGPAGVVWYPYAGWSTSA